tara:strand:+ start:396293 stop:396877 length:585 start_codon:yes stop_codon:yes gene_type:complete
VSLGISACTHPLNARLTLGGAHTPPTFVQSKPTTPPPPATGRDLFATTTPPRSNWTPTQYIAPLDAVVHSWALTLLPPVNKKAPPRILGLYPTANDALAWYQPIRQTQTAAIPPALIWINDAINTLNDLGRSFIGTPYAFGYLVATNQLAEPTTSPARVWKRTETQDQWSSGFPTPASPKTYTDTQTEPQEPTP